MCKDITKQKNDYELLIQEAKCDACKKCPFGGNPVGSTAAKFLDNRENLPEVVLVADNQIVSVGYHI